MSDTRTLWVRKTGRSWIAQLHITPADGTFPAGYCVSWNRIPGGKRTFPRLRREMAAKGIGFQIQTD